VFVSKTNKGQWYKWRNAPEAETWNEQGLKWYPSVSKALYHFVTDRIISVGVIFGLSVDQATEMIHAAYKIAGEEAFN
jgi:hypothetical protein